MDELHSRKKPADRRDEQGPASRARRALLKRGAAAMPIVLTLQSGAALARSSNLVGEAAPQTRDLDGNTLCLDTSSVTPLPEGLKYDFGDPAEGTVNVISDRVFYYEKNSSSVTTTHDMCQNGGAYFYKESGWIEVQLPTNGAVISAGSIVSVSARGDIFFNRIG